MFTLYKSKPKTVFRRVYTYKLEAKNMFFRKTHFYTITLRYKTL